MLVSAALTPKTVNALVSTEFENNRLTKPVAIGKSVYFVFDKGTYSGVREYYINENETKTVMIFLVIFLSIFLPTSLN